MLYHGVAPRRLQLSSFNELQRLLATLGDRARRLERLQAGSLILSAGLLALGVALLFAQLGAPRFGLGTWIMVLVATASLGLWRMRKPPDSMFGSATLAEALAPELGTAARSAVDLHHRSTTGDVPFSRDLASLHIERTASELQRVDLPARLEQRRQPRMHRLAWLLSVSLLWAVALLALLEHGRGRLFAMLLDPTAAQWSDVPLTGDLRLTYRYPAYTGLTARELDGGDGSISAVVGTEVEITAVADRPVRAALLRQTDLAGASLADIPLTVNDSLRLHGKLVVSRDALYHFAITDDDGDRFEERLSRSITAALDQAPEITLEAPLTDVELKDDQSVDLLWQARDDFGVAEVNLVLERTGRPAVRSTLADFAATATRREGRYRWTLSGEALAAGEEARFYLEAIDNDAVSGAKRGVSASRKISLFSAKRLHEDLLARQRALLDSLVDWLGQELIAPFPANGGAPALAAQQSLVDAMQRLLEQLTALAQALADDQLTPPAIREAWVNVTEHVGETRAERARDLGAVERSATAGLLARLGQRQRRQVERLEQDIVYLDDLLAVQRIDQLKQTAKDLLAAQRELHALLEQFRQTGDPALKAALEQQITALREQMMELLAKMAAIKDGLPGEYRNLEAAAMLKLDDMLAQLDQTLRDGDLDAAARELENLANMVENMMNALDRAEEEYGGERYAELRAQLNEFANQFRQLESEQQALAERAEQLVRDYRRRSLERAGKDLNEFVDRVRRKAAQALGELDRAATPPHLPRPTEEEAARARARLLDLDALLANRDLAEAQSMGEQAEEHARLLEGLLDNQLAWEPSGRDPELERARQASGRARRHTEEINQLLDRLFPEPDEVLGPEKRSEMQRLAQKQKQLEGQARSLGDKMTELGEQLPLFGGQPRDNLERAEREMGQAAGDMNAGELPGAATHKRRAVQALAELRQALEQAGKGGQGGLPLPLGQSGGRREGSGQRQNQEEVEIPAVDRNRAAPRYRQELMEAAKQRAPERYEESTRKYYEELIR